MRVTFIDYRIKKIHNCGIIIKKKKIEENENLFHFTFLSENGYIIYRSKATLNKQHETMFSIIVSSY